MSHTHVRAADDSPVQAVIDAVAAATDRSSLAMPPLGKVVDPDALNTLLSREDHRIEVTFDYLGCEVVASSEEVRVEAPDGE